jgi:hypothetical protein
MAFTHSRNIRIAAVACGLFGLLAIFYFHNDPVNYTSPEAFERLSGNRFALYFKGLSMTQHTGGRLVKIDADEFYVAPKKFNVFNFKPFNEMVLKNPRITTYRRNDESETPAPGSANDSQKLSFPKIELPANSFNPGSIKTVSGVRLDGLSWVIKDGENEYVKFLARQAYLNIAKSELEMEGLEIENMELGRRISAKKGWLDLKASLVKIPKSSITHARAVSISSHFVLLDMNLNQMPL